MVFSREEKQIWEGSEVMRELERIAQEQSLETPDEAFLPIGEGQDWEDEFTDEEKLLDALREFEKNDDKNIELNEEGVIPEHDKGLSNPTNFIRPEYDKLFNDEEGILKEHEGDEVKSFDWRGNSGITEIEAQLMSGLNKLASHLAKQGKVVEAHKIENTIRDIRMTLEANNG